MKGIVVAFLVIASVADGNLRASKHDDDPVNAFVEMKSNSSTNRELQMGMETTTIEEASLIIEAKKEDDTQEQSQLLNRFRQKASVTRVNAAGFDTHMNDVSDGGANSNFDVRIVGGDVSDPNEFPYFGTSLHLAV